MPTVIGAGGGASLRKTAIQVYIQAPPARNSCDTAFADRTQIASLPATWQPSLLSSLRMWLKADDLTGADGSTVPAWDDATGAGFSPTAGNSPSIKTAFLNSKNVIEFDAATSDYFTIPAGTFAGIGEGSVFFVAKRRADPPGLTTSAGPVIGEVGSHIDESNYPWVTGIVYDDFLSANWHTVGDPGDLSAWHLGSFQSKASDWRYAFNGTDSFTTTSNTFGTTGAGYIGRNTTGQNFDGYIAEVVAFSSFLTTDERQKVEGYLAHKWGLAANLAADHPYKAAPPPAVVADASISGMAGLTFAGSASSAATGALGGSSLLSAKANASISGLAPVGGSANFSFSGSATALGSVFFTASSSLSTVAAASLAGRGVLAGFCPTAFSLAGTVSGRGTLGGTSATAFGTAATVRGVVNAVGVTSLSLSSSAVSAGRGDVVGSAALSFNLSGSAEGSAPGDLSGLASVSLTAAGNITAIAGLSGQADFQLEASAGLTAIFVERPKRFVLRGSDLEMQSSSSRTYAGGLRGRGRSYGGRRGR